MDNTNINNTTQAGGGGANVGNGNGGVTNGGTTAGGGAVSVENKSQMNKLQTTVDQTIMERFLNSYQLVSLELISIFCNLKRISFKQQNANETATATTTAATPEAIECVYLNCQLNTTNEIKILNLIIKTIKNVDLEIETIIDLIKCEVNNKQFNRLFNFKMFNLINEPLLEIKSLITDLKIHFIIQPNTDALIKPWSIVGRYVRRCIIIYEKLTFHKLNNLCKNVSMNLKQLKFMLQDDEVDDEMVERQRIQQQQQQDTDNLDSSIILSNLIGEPDKCSSTFKQVNKITFVNNNKFKGQFQRPQNKVKLMKAMMSGNSNNANNNDHKDKCGATAKTVKQTRRSGGEHDHHGNMNILSRKIAEYFVSKQAYLIENNDYDALQPIMLQQKLDQITQHDQKFIDVYYLKYLNMLRLNDYTMSLKYLHDYFDRFILSGSISLAALNLTSFEYRFLNRDNALNSLMEAITSAHQENDNVKCLQYCLSWLYKLTTSGAGAANGSGSGSGSSLAEIVNKKMYICKNSCSKALNYDLFDLASFNLHYFTRLQIGVQKPYLLLDLLNKIDLINIKINSKTELNLLNKCHKASLWKLYGNRHISNLYCQLLLNLLPKPMDTNSDVMANNGANGKLNTESQLISMCYLALSYADNGQFAACSNILNLCKMYYSKNNVKLCEHWLYTDNLCLIRKYLFNGQWSNAKIFIERLASTNEPKALIEEMNMNILEGNLDKANAIGERLLEYNLKVDNASSGDNGGHNISEEEIYINLWSNRIEINIKQKDFSNALISAIKLYYQIKQLDFNYELNLCSLLIAKILLEMKHPQQAIKYLEKSFIFILSSGTLLDQAKLHYLYSKCLFMLLIDNADGTAPQLIDVNLCVTHMQQCIDKLENAQAFIYLKEAYSFISLLFNFMGVFNERNKYSLKYRLLTKQFPCIGFLL